MIPFIQLPYKAERRARATAEIGPLATAMILALILCFQLALLVWVFLKDWRS
jgi:hypothetical protein